MDPKESCFLMKKLGKSNRVLYHLDATDFMIRVASATETLKETVFTLLKISCSLSMAAFPFQ